MLSPLPAGRLMTDQSASGPGASTWRAQGSRPVATGSYSGWGSAPTRNNSDDGEATRPRHLLGRGQRDLQQAQCFQLACATQPASVNGTQTTGGDDAGQQ